MIFFLKADIRVRVDTCTSLLPDGKPRYVMGVVRPEFLKLIGVVRNSAYDLHRVIRKTSSYP